MYSPYKSVRWIQQNIPWNIRKWIGLVFILPIVIALIWMILQYKFVVAMYNLVWDVLKGKTKTNFYDYLTEEIEK